MRKIVGIDCEVLCDCACGSDENEWNLKLQSQSVLYEQTYQMHYGGEKGKKEGDACGERRGGKKKNSNGESRGRFEKYHFRSRTS